MQSFVDINATTKIKESRELLLNNDKTIMSCNSGTLFPTQNLEVGMLCLRTDQNKLYQLKDKDPTWILIADLNDTNIYDAETLDGYHASYFAPIASPALVGTPTAPTAIVGTNTQQLATTAFVKSQISNDAPSKTGAGASGTWGINITGTAPRLQTARNINNVAFDGSSDITIPTIPTGGIIMWSGSIASIPSGWALCNGQNGTPNLMDRFIVGAGSSYGVGATGGEAQHTLTVNEMPSHNHTIYNGGTTNDDNPGANHPWLATISDRRTGTKTTWDAGGNAAHENRPPYYALAYIMKL